MDNLFWIKRNTFFTYHYQMDSRNFYKFSCIADFLTRVLLYG